MTAKQQNNDISQAEAEDELSAKKGVFTDGDLLLKIVIICTIAICILPFAMFKYYETSIGTVLVALFFIFGTIMLVLMFPITLMAVSPDRKKEDALVLVANFVVFFGGLLVAYAGIPRWDKTSFLQFCMFQSMAIVAAFFIVTIMAGKRLRTKIIKNPHIAVGLMFILIIATLLQFLVMVSFGEEAQVSMDGGSATGGDREMEPVQLTHSWSGYLTETEETVESLDLTEIGEEENIMSVDMSFTLSWIDEADETYRHENQPDGFQMVITDSTGNELAVSDVTYNDPNSKIGTIILNARIDYSVDPSDYDEQSYTWEVHITCVDCGNHEARFFSLREFPDNGNDWTLDGIIEYRCY